MTRYYRLFDLALPSELPLPNLPELPNLPTLPALPALPAVPRASAGDQGRESGGPGAAQPPQPAGLRAMAPLHIRAGWPDDVAAAAVTEQVVYHAPHASAFASLGRAGEDYLLEFAGCAGFLLRADGSIYQRLHAGADQVLAAHFLVNQAVPRALHRAGETLLHAAALRLPGGATVAFPAHSGWGKSTLATALHRAGAQLLSDDCLLLRMDDSAAWVAGLFPGARLAPGTVRALLGGNSGAGERRDAQRPFGPVSAHSGKQQGIFAEAPPEGLPDASPNGLRGASSAALRPLDALVFLNDPARPAQQISFTPLRGAAALMALMQNQTVLDPSLEQTSVRLLRQGGALLERVPCCDTLAFPRSFSELPAVVEGVLRRFPAQRPQKADLRYS